MEFFKIVSTQYYHRIKILIPSKSENGWEYMYYKENYAPTVDSNRAWKCLTLQEAEAKLKNIKENVENTPGSFRNWI
jgi:hypothetical protein